MGPQWKNSRLIEEEELRFCVFFFSLPPLTQSITNEALKWLRFLLMKFNPSARSITNGAFKG
ncbi:unnamed protein product [Thlaspi arvense]|uniref:Uncharacterized protein n=1 Tax=Thlaspi arvense TaxID=13288 RepID=A0AAU9RBE5_THLAR|nr:unnamed protein product [Thlaspi arvense]